MRILVTGGTGFIGSNIVKELLKQGHDIVITGTDAEIKLPDFKGIYLQPSFLGLDYEAIGHVDALLHQAAINDTTNENEKEVFRANLESSQAIINHVVKNGCKKVVYASSTAIYGNVPAPHQRTTQVV